MPSLHAAHTHWWKHGLNATVASAARHTQHSVGAGGSVGAGAAGADARAASADSAGGVRVLRSAPKARRRAGLEVGAETRSTQLYPTRLSIIVASDFSTSASPGTASTSSLWLTPQGVLMRA
jgi:hypothetical protein